MSCREFATQILSGSNSDSPISLSFEKQSQLVTPNILIVATITQAMINIKAIEIEYISPQSGLSQRVVIAHSIVDNGLHWHIRAFDEKSQQFKDFVITRIMSAKLIDKPILDNAKILADQQWMRIVHLELVLHPTNVRYTQAIECDYGMDQGLLKLEVRSALTGYILRRWNVDCSENATQYSPEHHLWLRNRATLYGVDNLHLASGYDELKPATKSTVLKDHLND
ncbi:WYL domain-containing protein [Shewanella livingstonensis]|uniref:WYL domain-containing protein n=1 Tax=Shewanella livingstonensis TaxID=150120 RepID=UPI001ABFA6C1|nr:WYL domain-containing protein [Shewanella livingstonensis]